MTVEVIQAGEAGPIPVEFYQWLYGIERDTCVWDLTPNEIVQLRAALSTTTRVDATDGEREACAKIADAEDEPGKWDHPAGNACARAIASAIRARQPSAPVAVPDEVGRLREGAEQHLCGHCGAQYLLLGADYLDRISEALDAIGAPRKSPDGNHHYSITDRITALSRQPAAEADEVGRRLLADAFETLVYIFECSEDEQASRTAKEAADKIEGFLALNRADNAEATPPVAADNAALVERLRAADYGHHDPFNGHWWQDPLTNEAADALAAKDAEIAALRRVVAEALSEIDALGKALKVLGMSVASDGVERDIAAPLRAFLTTQEGSEA